MLRSCAADPKSPHAADAFALGPGASSGAARAFFEDRFLPHLIAESARPGFVTGYYEPEIEGSYVRGGPFQVPVYRRPEDLITLAPETERARFNDRITGFRQAAGGEVPYYTRGEIWDGALSGRGLDLLYLEGHGRIVLHAGAGIGPRASEGGRRGQARLFRQERPSLHLDRQAPHRARRDRALCHVDGGGEGVAQEPTRRAGRR